MTITDKPSREALGDLIRGQLGSLADRLVADYQIARGEVLETALTELLAALVFANDDTSPDHPPIVPAYQWRLESGAVQTGYWCDACREAHVHIDAGDNECRRAGCHDQKSPFLRRSYRLAVLGRVRSQAQLPRLSLPELMRIVALLSEADRIRRARGQA